MVSRNVSLDDEAYNRLKALKEEGESFSDAVKRITREHSLTEIAGMITEEAEEMKEEIEERA